KGSSCAGRCTAIVLPWPSSGRRRSCARRPGVARRASDQSLDKPGNLGVGGLRAGPLHAQTPSNARAMRASAQSFAASKRATRRATCSRTAWPPHGARRATTSSRRRPRSLGTGYEAVVGDLLMPDTLAEACGGVTHVYHLAHMLFRQRTGEASRERLMRYLRWDCPRKGPLSQLSAGPDGRASSVTIEFADRLNRAVTLRVLAANGV